MAKRQLLIVITSVVTLSVMSCITFVSFRAELDCPWNKYIDTKFSESLSPQNIEIIHTIDFGMTKNEVIYFLGDPLYINKLRDNRECYVYTADGAAPDGWDFSWFEAKIYFENYIVVSRKIGWVYD